MEQQESNLFEVRITSIGKKYINQFARISYILFALVLFESVAAVHLNIQRILFNSRFEKPSMDEEYSLYNEVYPYIGISITIMVLVANIYYLKFPQKLKRSIELNDTEGANLAFKGLAKGAMLFLLYMIIGTIELFFGFFSTV